MPPVGNPPSSRPLKESKLVCMIAAFTSIVFFFDFYGKSGKNGLIHRLSIRRASKQFVLLWTFLSIEVNHQLLLNLRCIQLAATIVVKLETASKRWRCSGKRSLELYEIPSTPMVSTRDFKGIK
jgi:hypothetical protein